MPKTPREILPCTVQFGGKVFETLMLAQPWPSIMEVSLAIRTHIRPGVLLVVTSRRIIAIKKEDVDILFVSTLFPEPSGRCPVVSRVTKHALKHTRNSSCATYLRKSSASLCHKIRASWYESRMLDADDARRIIGHLLYSEVPCVLWNWNPPKVYLGLFKSCPGRNQSRNGCHLCSC